MVCFSKIDNGDISSIDVEDLFRQTSHLDPRRMLKNTKNEIIEWIPIRNFTAQLVWGKNIETKHDYTKRMSELRRDFKEQINGTPSTVTLNYAYKCILQEAIDTNTIDEFPRKPHIEKFMRGKTARINSGVLVFTVLTSGKRGFKGGRGGCQWNCHYCPNEPDMPRSYLKKEPAVARADANDFDAFRQIWDRASVLFLQGKHIDKIEIIVEGGTIASYDKMYLRKFMRDLYYAFNTFYQPNDKRRQIRYVLEKEMMLNENALCKVIGLTLETRPDCINETEIKFFREVGCTRVQLGIQHLDDNILKNVNRGCYYKDAVNAIKRLKDCGFKVDGHWMTDLPGSNPVIDKKMFDQVLQDHNVQVDDWKIYPCQTVDYSQILNDFNNSITYFKEFLVAKGHTNIRFKKEETIIRLKPLFKEYCQQNNINHTIHHQYFDTWRVIKIDLPTDIFIELVNDFNNGKNIDRDNHYSSQKTPVDDFIESFKKLMIEINQFETYETQYTQQFLNPIDEYDSMESYQHLIKPRFTSDMKDYDRLKEMIRYCSTWEPQHSHFIPYLKYHNSEKDLRDRYLANNPPTETIDCMPHNNLMTDFYKFLMAIEFDFHDNIDDNIDNIDDNHEYGKLTNEELESLFEEFCQETNVQHYKPYTHDFIPTKDLTTSNLRKLIDVCKSVKRKIHPWIRINRLVRDIPHDYIRAGLERADLRQVIQQKLEVDGTPCMCIRCCEIKGQTPAEIYQIHMKTRVYEASDGIEYFISLEDNDNNLYGFTRLRLCHQPGCGFIPELAQSALIRELHVYGEMIPVWDKPIDGNVVQHRGFGKQLICEAERIARYHGYNKMAIIAGNGVRNYYNNKLGYQLEGTYVTKKLKYAYIVPKTNHLIDWKNQQWSYVTLHGSPIYIKPTDVDPECFMSRSKYLVKYLYNNPIFSTVVAGITSLFIKKTYEYMMMEQEQQ